MKVLITGATGQLGSAAHAHFAGRHDVVALSRAALDLSDATAVTDRVEAERPELILNCAAYTNVDGAEDHPLEALRVNAIGVQSLARAAADHDAVLVHYSTDFVFDGRAASPYVETDAPRPQGVYAASKLLGEWLAAACPSAYVLRVESLFGGPAAKSSVDKILDALSGGRPAPVFVDRIVSPSYVFDVVTATEELIARAAPYGLYHCVNTGSATWHELGEALVRRLACSNTLQPVSFASVSMKAVRPRYCALSNDKLRRAGVDMPTWQNALDRYVARWRARREQGARELGTGE